MSDSLHIEVITVTETACISHTTGSTELFLAYHLNSNEGTPSLEVFAMDFLSFSTDNKYPRFLSVKLCSGDVDAICKFICSNMCVCLCICVRASLLT